MVRFSRDSWAVGGEVGKDEERRVKGGGGDGEGRGEGERGRNYAWGSIHPTNPPLYSSFTPHKWPFINAVLHSLAAIFTCLYIRVYNWLNQTVRQSIWVTYDHFTSQNPFNVLNNVNTCSHFPPFRVNTPLRSQNQQIRLSKPASKIEGFGKKLKVFQSFLSKTPNLRSRLWDQIFQSPSPASSLYTKNLKTWKPFPVLKFLGSFDGLQNHGWQVD